MILVILLKLIHSPIELQDKLKELPPAPDNLNPELEWLSDYQQEAGALTNIINNSKCMGCNKLVPKPWLKTYTNFKYKEK